MSPSDVWACKKCGPLPKADFYKSNPRLCKKCVIVKVKTYRKTNLEQIRAYDQLRGALEHRKERNRQFSKSYTKDGRHGVVVRAWRTRNPEKYAAYNALNNAIRDGMITKGPCEVCGETRGVEGHHDDYSKPLEVRWRCKQHHEDTHHK